MLIFSDMQEDLPPGAKRDMDPEELENTHVVAMNVKRLQHDTIDPAVFRGRLAPGATGSPPRVQPSGAPSWTPPSSPTTCPRFAERQPGS